MKKSSKIAAVVLPTLLLVIILVSAIFSSRQKAKELITGDIPELDKNAPENTETATFSLGCFWGPDSRFGAVPGVVRTRVGYAGGTKENPTYRNLGDHTETIQIDYDPEKVSYEELLDVFWNSHDPTYQKSTQYRSIIFYHEGQKELAQDSFDREQKNSSYGILTDLRPYSKFYRAEDYHQKYHLRQVKEIYYAYEHIYPKNRDFVDSTAVARANGYVSGHGTIDSKDDLNGMGLTKKGKEVLYTRWKGVTQTSTDYCDLPNTTGGFVKPSDEELKKMLTPLQYKVTQEKGTEPAFNNEYYDNKREGIYVDLVSGEVLFSSTDKFRSGTGWPSFSKPLEPDNIVTRKESGFLDRRTEVKSKLAGSHLGHLFNDGPAPTGKRYCMNSAALSFIPKEDMESQGYGDYLYLFE
ncbi:MAG: peptide-methionine (R)-S-oxide reductase MsrB [Thermoplasmata archaeon]